MGIVFELELQTKSFPKLMHLSHNKRRDARSFSGRGGGRWGGGEDFLVLERGDGGPRVFNGLKGVPTFAKDVAGRGNTKDTENGLIKIAAR